MTAGMHACPGELELARLVDRDLSDERAERTAAHLASCARCAELHAKLLDLRGRLGERPVLEFDRQAHITAIMRRIDAPRARGGLRWLPWAGAAALLALGAVAVRQLQPRGALPGGVAARGGGARSSIARDVGVQTYASDGTLRPLAPGDAIAADTPLAAGYRNLGSRPVFLLLFAVDTRHALHWIAPAYGSAASDPAAQALWPSTSERLLPTTVVFEDLAPGPLRIVSVISPRRERVSAIEALSATELDARAIARRLPEVEVRESTLQVRERDGVQR